MNLLEAFAAHNILFRRSASDQNEISICCPFCFETRFRLGINLRKDKAHCFNCDWKSRHALEDLAETLKLGQLNPGVQEKEEIEAEPPQLPEDFVLLDKVRNDALYRKAYVYLRNRGVGSHQIREKHLGVSMVGRYAYRVVFPLCYGDELQGLVTRDFTNTQEPPYLNSPGMKAVYNSPQKEDRKKKAVLCEGVFDCLAIERTVPREYDVLALLGRSLTESQERRLIGYNEIVLWPDADVPGISGFTALGAMLRLHYDISIVPPAFDGRKDAAEISGPARLQLWQHRRVLTDSLALKLRTEVALHE